MYFRHPMFKIAYIILAHNNPPQLLKLIRSLESENHYIFLHLDKRAAVESFLTLDGFTSVKNLFLLPRFISHWGGIGLVNATLAGIQKAVEYKCEYSILLSGADYPIKSHSAIASFLANANGKSFINHDRLPLPHWLPNQEINRIKKYYFRLNGKLFEYPNHPEVKTLPRKLVNLILGLFLPNERTFPKNIVPYGGEQWFCLSINACVAVLKFHEHHPELHKFLRHSLIPDEIFFQTALLNGSSPNLLTSIVNETVTFVNWKNKNNPSPACFDTNDFEQLATSKKLFARKFDFSKSYELMDNIDTKLLKIK